METEDHIPDDIPDEIEPTPQIVYIRLLSGEEVIGLCLGEDPQKDVVVLKAPMLMSEMINPYNQSQAIVLSKFILFGDCEVIPIKNDQVVVMSTVLDEMQDFYNNSVLYTREFAHPYMLDELKQSNKAIKHAITSEQVKRFKETSPELTGGRPVITPSNNTLH